MAIEIAPSILSANFSRLAADAKAALDGGGTLLHVDVMDGHFVPNITIGPPVVASLRKALPGVILDCHLMIENPDNFIPAFADAGRVGFPFTRKPARTFIARCSSSNPMAANPVWLSIPRLPCTRWNEVLDIVHHVLVMSVNPGFGGQKFIPAALQKIKTLVEVRESLGQSFRIEVDGGVALDTVGDVVRAGAELLVAGNAIFGKGDITENARKLLQAARSATLTHA